MLSQHTTKQILRPIALLSIAILCNVALWLSLGLFSPVVLFMAGANAGASLFIGSTLYIEHATGGKDA